MYSYRAHVYDLYAAALSKGVAVLVACDEHEWHRLEGHVPTENLSDLRTRFGALRMAVESLITALPTGVGSVGELEQHMAWGRYWIDEKGRPREWGSDARSIVERDLPTVLNAFNDWYATASGVDPELVERLHPFNSVAHINSAIRETWAIFKTRVIEAYGLPDDIDGHPLIERLFGNNDPAVSSLSDGERLGYRNLFKGLYTLHRNPVAHNDQEPNPAEADAVIALLGVYLSRIAPPEADADK